MNNKGVKSAGGFKMLLNTYPYGTDPAVPGVLGRPRPNRKTVTQGPILSDAGALGNGMMITPNTGPVQATGSFKVADNTFPGTAELIMGDYRLINNFDYLIGAAAADTATNIAAAISRVPGFSATALVDVVTVNYIHAADDTEFRAIQHSTVLSFTLFTGNGYLTKGVPVAGPPVFTH